MLIVITINFGDPLRRRLELLRDIDTCLHPLGFDNVIYLTTKCSCFPLPLPPTTDAHRRPIVQLSSLCRSKLAQEKEVETLLCKKSST